MKRLAALVAALVLMEATLTAQTSNRMHSRPAVPTTDALDRLNLKLGWKAFMPVDGTKDGILTAQVLGDQMYVQLRSGGVIALNAETGQKLWHARFAPAYKSHFALGHNHNTIFQLAATHLYAIDRASGQLAWTYDLPSSPTAGPVADAEHLYIISIGNKLTVYNIAQIGPREGPAPGTHQYVMAKKDAEIRKATASESTPESRAGYATQGKIGERGIDSVVQGPYANLGIGGGKNNWHLPVAWHYTNEGRLDQTPVLTPRSDNHPGYVLMAGHDGSLAVSSKVERQIMYRLQAQSAISAPMNQHGDTVYAGLENGSLVAGSIEYGRVLWRTGFGGAILYKPAVTDEDIFVTSSRGGLHRVDRKKGEIIWRNADAERFLAENKKVVFALDKLGNLLLLDRARGTKLTSYDARDFTVPVENDYTDRVYLAANDGLIVMLRDRDNAKAVWNKKFVEDKPIRKMTPEDREREALKKEMEKEAMKKKEDKEMEKKEEKKD